MSSSPVDPPHLVSLVLQSKKALQHGEQLCTKAHAASSDSAQAAVDVLALDAKVRWVVEAVVEQLQLAANVAKIIEEKRAQIGKRVLEWDADRTKHTDVLDEILESLGSQVVPPDFHQVSSDSSSLFGSQHSADLENGKEEKTKRQGSSSPVTSLKGYTLTNGSSGTIKYQARPSISPVSPSATLRRNFVRRLGDSGLENIPEGGLKGKERKQDALGEGKKEDRKWWKTLRDFVDDQAIENILETIDNDRSALDGILSKTDDYPETLTRTIQNIQSSLPFAEDDESSTLARVQRIIAAQEQLVGSMAGLLENLANHYDGMASALKDTENGEVFNEEDLQSMNRDTEELPVIMKELEDNAGAIDEYQNQLNSNRSSLRNDLEHLSKILDDLDELGEIMEEMIQTQESVEVQVDEELKGLQEQLEPLKALHGHFVAYRTAFNKLLLEMERRRQYREAADNIVRGMMKQLDSMTEEENRVRNHFNDEYGSSLPSDLCLYVSNAPTRWEIVPWDGSAPEVLPLIASDLVVEAREKVSYSIGPSGTESL